MHESIGTEQSNYSEASNNSVPQSTNDSYPSLSQLCDVIDLSIDAGI